MIISALLVLLAVTQTNAICSCNWGSGNTDFISLVGLFSECDIGGGETLVSVKLLMYVTNIDTDCATESFLLQYAVANIDITNATLLERTDDIVSWSIDDTLLSVVFVPSTAGNGIAPSTVLGGFQFITTDYVSNGIDFVTTITYDNSSTNQTCSAGSGTNEANVGCIEGYPLEECFCDNDMYTLTCDVLSTCVSATEDAYACDLVFTPLEDTACSPVGRYAIRATFTSDGSAVFPEFSENTEYVTGVTKSISTLEIELDTNAINGSSVILGRIFYLTDSDTYLVSSLQLDSNDCDYIASADIEAGVCNESIVLPDFPEFPDCTCGFVSIDAISCSSVSSCTESGEEETTYSCQVVVEPDDSAVSANCANGAFELAFSYDTLGESGGEEEEEVRKRQESGTVDLFFQPAVVVHDVTGNGSTVLRVQLRDSHRDSNDDFFVGIVSFTIPTESVVSINVAYISTFNNLSCATQTLYFGEDVPCFDLRFDELVGITTSQCCVPFVNPGENSCQLLTEEECDAVNGTLSGGLAASCDDTLCTKACVRPCDCTPTHHCILSVCDVDNGLCVDAEKADCPKMDC
jgi:hypothetical protein